MYCSEGGERTPNLRCMRARSARIHLKNDPFTSLAESKRVVFVQIRNWIADLYKKCYDIPGNFYIFKEHDHDRTNTNQKIACAR
jgi:hypothetical protein